jgi:N-formylmaleamate deformylase
MSFSKTPSESDIAIVRAYPPIEALIPAHWRQGSVVANGVRHHYYRTGSNRPPLVLLHGFMDGALTWLATARALEADYDMVLVDSRGHGRSERIGKGFEQEQLTEDMAELLRALGLGPARFVGHSQGAATGIHLAAAHPDLVSALVVEGAPESGGPQGDPSQSPAYRAWIESYLAWLEQLKALSHEQRMASALGHLPPGKTIHPAEEYVAWVDICANLDLDMVRLGGSLWASLPGRVAEMQRALEQIQCPVLVIKSGFFPSPGAPKAMHEEPSGQANVRIVRFENVGHFVHQECFEQYVDLLREFFTQPGRA